MPLTLGRRLGPYEILSPLGAGGMGEVYRARDRRLERDVAVKVLPEHLAQNPSALTRFARETKALAALSHPNLLVIFDTGAEDGVNYAVTELLEGETLRAALTRGPLGWRKAVEIGAALADGLAAAHSKGVTHRDVKPENVFLTAGGQAKVLDFGLAAMTSPPDSSASSSSVNAETVTRTQAGTVMGTPGYLSPEQVRGETAGPASDIFSLGCVLYEMCGGRRAFSQTTVMELLSSILRDTPADLAAVGVAIPAELKRLIDQCLDKNPARRVASARDLAAQLRAVANPPSGAVTAPGVIDSIAVLPFTNASQDPDAEYLSDGITESILNGLSQIAQLRVVPRTTVFRYKGKDLDPQAVGRELNVRVVLTGRVMHRGEMLVVGAELVDVQAGSQLWGERYNRKIADIFALEEEIATKISASLRMKLSGEEKSRIGKRFTENTEAYQLYLRGRHHWVKRAPDQVQKAAEYFQQAIAKDPGYALAYAGLADCYAILGVYSIIPTKDAFARAKAAAAAAVAFDEELAEAHTSLGFIRAHFDWDWEAAHREYNRAWELNPGYWVTPYWHGMAYTSSGRFEEAEQQIRNGLALEPLSPVVAHGAAMNSVMAGRYGEAIERSLKGIENNPEFFINWMWLGIAHGCEGRFDEAIRCAEKGVELCSRRVSWAVGAVGYAHAQAGNRAAAEEILLELLDLSQRESVDALAIALLYAGLGDKESTLTWIEKACDTRGMIAVLARNDPRFAHLHGEPRFQAVLCRMNL